MRLEEPGFRLETRGPSGRSLASGYVLKFSGQASRKPRRMGARPCSLPILP